MWTQAKPNRNKFGLVWVCIFNLIGSYSPTLLGCNPNRNPNNLNQNVIYPPPDFWVSRGIWHYLNKIKRVMGSAFMFVKLTVRHSQFINLEIIYFTWLCRQLVLHLLRQKCSSYGGHFWNALSMCFCGLFV